MINESKLIKIIFGVWLLRILFSKGSIVLRIAFVSDTTMI